MLEQIPDETMLKDLLGASLYEVWRQLDARICESYEMERVWNSGGKAWTYEYKYRRGGKTLCALYARPRCVGWMVIFGKNERARFEATRDTYSALVQKVYDETPAYRDGKWLMFEPTDASLFDEFMRLLAIKRKPNRKNL